MLTSFIKPLSVVKLAGLKSPGPALPGRGVRSIALPRTTIRICTALALLPFLVTPCLGDNSDAITYTLRFDDAKNHRVDVELRAPTGGRSELELLMAVWTPGSYLVREYARHVESLSVTTGDGATLKTRKSQKNRWRIETSGAEAIVARYRLYCREMTVRSNWVDHRFAILNGAPTFLTLADVTDDAERPHVVRLVLPENWQRSITALHRGEREHEYVAPDFDALVDSPIYAGNPAVYEFEVGGRPHLLVNEGEGGVWDGAKSAADVERIVREHQKLWGVVPYERYIFLNLITEGRGGLEHDNSTVLMTSRWKFRVRKDYLDWLGLVSHEFFHTWNVRRLRPRPLVEYDYENELYTRSLWIAEGITSYYDELVLARTRLATRDEYLRRFSKSIERLQSTPGRLVQSLSESSYDTWIKFYRPHENSANTTVSYYVKGAVVAFLLDAEIRRSTGGEASLDDVLRRLYAEFSGERGYTPEAFRRLASEIAGKDLRPWFAKTVDSAEELDYGPALEWYGLVFQEPPSKRSEESGNEIEGKEDRPAWAGVKTRSSAGRLVIASVVSDSPATRSGLNAGDEIIAVGGYRVGPDSWKQRLEQYKPGDTKKILVARRQRLVELELTFAEPPPKKWQLIVSPDATPEQLAHLNVWLGLSQEF